MPVCRQRQPAGEQGIPRDHQAGDEAGDLEEEQRCHRHQHDRRQHRRPAHEEQRRHHQIEHLADLAIVDAEAVRTRIGVVFVGVEGQQENKRNGRTRPNAAARDWPVGLDRHGGHHGQGEASSDQWAISTGCALGNSVSQPANR